MTDLDIQRNLRTTFIGRKMFIYESAESTNEIAKTIYRTAADGTVIFAEEQTAGKGRLGRKWFSAKGESLTFSVILRPEIRQSHIGILSLFASLAVAETVGDLLGISPECKWPNDVLIHGKKCCGILSEASFVNDSCAGIVIGIGININQREFPPEISSTAISLYQAGNRLYQLETVLAMLLLNIERRYSLILQYRYDDIRQAWLRYATMIGKEVTIIHPNNTYRGIAKRIEENGELVLLCDGTEKRFASGDVSLRD